MSAEMPSAAGAGPRRSSALPVLGLTWLALVAGVLLAGPAAAVDDSTRPDARVTHGPSCRPGGVVVEVVAGTVPYAVTLATTRAPEGEDSADVGAGGTVVLRTGGVDWGETIDGWLEYRALDGSGASWVDDLAGYTFTRPAEEDCAAISAPAAPATVPGSSPPSSPGSDPVGPAADAGPARAIEPGGQGEPVPAEEGIEAVDLDTAGTGPAAARRETSLAPLLVAAVALGSAVAGLVGTLGVPGLRRRRPTPGA